MATIVPNHFGQNLAGDWAAITPDDSNDLPNGTCSGIWIGSIAGGATVTVISRSGNTGVFNGCNAGTPLPVRARRVMATGTTATSLVALY